MSEPIPCPACGTSHSGGESTCKVCGYSLQGAGPSNQGTGRCARCGNEMPREFDFCPICGMDQRRRLSRPSTGALRVSIAPGGQVLTRAQPPQPGTRPPSMTPTAPPVVDAPARAPSQPGVPAGAVALHAPLPGRAPPMGRMPAAAAPAPAASPQAPPRGRAPPASAGPPSGWGPPSTAPAASLVCIERDGSEGRSFVITGEALTIGRIQGDVLFDQDPFVSPVHARLERVEEGRFALVDANSRNGVYLRITRPEPVYPGDLFLVGHQLLRLENVDASGEQPADAEGTRLFGTPMDPPWGRLAIVGRGSMVGNAYHLRATSMVIGRESGDMIFPTDRFLSRQHARLQLQMSGQSMSVFLEDLGSANGTYLKLRGRATIGANDTFRVGDQILRVKVE